jgi:hypothetical protein
MRWLFLSLTVTGVALRLWQYAGDASLWLDELALARNIVDRPLGRLLFEPLDYDQIAPRGFLLVEKLAVAALGPSGYALRLFPLLGGIAAVLLFRKVAERILSPGAAALSLASFALGIPLIWYSALVKPYSVDVAAALFLLWLALKLRDGTERRHGWIIGAAGAVTPFFSHAAVLVLTGLGAALVAGASIDRDWRRLRILMSVVLLWAVGSATAVLEGHQSISPETRMFFERSWQAGFMPLPPGSLIDALWVGRQLNRMFGYQALWYPWPVLYVALMAVGGVTLWRRQRDLAFLLAAPAAVTLAASAMRLYPFDGRVILFLLPSFLLAVAEGADRIRRLIPARWFYARGVALAAAIVAPALAIVESPPVYRIEETRPALSYLQSHRRSGDGLYIYYRVWQAVSFYGPRYGLTSDDYVVGGCHLGQTRRYLEEIDRFRGRPRVWFLFLHSPGRRGDSEEIVRYLDSIGTRRETIPISPQRSASTESKGYVYLYDLSDPVRLASTSAGGLSLRETAVGDRLDYCLHGPQVPRQPGF